MHAYRDSLASILTGAAWLLAGAVAAAQEPGAAAADTADPYAWSTRAKFNLGLAQSSFTQNWSGDEVGTLSWLAGADLGAEKQMHPKFKWTNTLVLGFGQTHQQDAERRTWLVPQKAADKIDFDSVGRLTLQSWVDPFVAFQFDSQFYQRPPGLATKVFNPMTFGETAGVSRAFWDTKPRSLVTRVGFGFRQAVDRFEVTSPGKKATNDGGFEWRTVGRFATSEDRVVVKTDLNVFQAVFFSESSTTDAGGNPVDPNARWKSTDVRWQNTFSNKLNTFLSLDLYLDYVFDAQVRRAGQLKQTLGISVTWSM